LQDIGDQNNWEYAHLLFQCPAAAIRPPVRFMVEELAEFRIPGQNQFPRCWQIGAQKIQ
jgi:hypothetical protein